MRDGGRGLTERGSSSSSSSNSSSIVVIVVVIVVLRMKVLRTPLLVVCPAQRKIDGENCDGRLLARLCTFARPT